MRAYFSTGDWTGIPAVGGAIAAVLAVALAALFFVLVKSRGGVFFAVVIALFLIAKPALVWMMTESWKLGKKRERSEWYDLVLRIVGGTFLVVGVLLAFGIMR